MTTWDGNLKCAWCDAEVLDELACPNSPDICVDCCPCHSEDTTSQKEPIKMKKPYTITYDSGESQDVGSKKTAVKKGDESGESYTVTSPSGAVVHEVKIEAEPVLDPKIQDALDGKFGRDYPGNYAPQLAGIATSIADAFGGIRHETESVKGRLNKVVTFRGEEAHLAAFREMVDMAIEDAKEGLHAWQKANIEERRNLTDMQRFNQHRAFFDKFAVKSARAVKKARS